MSVAGTKKAPSGKAGIDEQFAKELAEQGLSGFFLKILERDDMSVETLTTGLPRLDKALYTSKPGLPKGRRIEIFSKDPEVGKTSIALQIGVAWQKLGMIVVIVDVEDTITEEYLVVLGYVLDPEPDSGMYPVRLMKAYDPDTGETMTAEAVCDLVGRVSKICDLTIVDSMAALAKKADLDRDVTNSSAQPGGIGKIMQDHCRRYAHTRATVIWINQALPQIGGYNPTGNIRYKTTGGNAIPFYSSIRLELRLDEKLKGKDDEIYGVKIEVYVFKNKISAPYRRVLLTYINGKGFCPIWDTFEAAKKEGIIEKKGSWLSFGEEKTQGDLEFYKSMCDTPDLLQAIQIALAGQTE